MNFIDEIDFFAATFEERKNTIASQLGFTLWKIRKAIGLKQQEVVKAASVTRRFLTYVENKQGGSLELILKLFYYYDTHYPVPPPLREEFSSLLIRIWYVA